jgi:hypothetical protein
MSQYAKVEEMLVAAYHEINEIAWDSGDSDSKLSSIQSILYQVEQNIDHLTSQSQSVE